MDRFEFVLKDALRISDDGAAFEYRIRSGSFVKFDEGLIGEAQQIADILYDGHAIRKKVKVDVEYDPQSDAAQKAIRPIRSNDQYQLTATIGMWHAAIDPERARARAGARHSVTQYRCAVRDIRL